MTSQNAPLPEARTVSSATCPKWLERFRQWYVRHLSPRYSFLVLALVTGIMAGCGAAVLKYGIGGLTIIVDRIRDISHHSRLVLLLAPVVGIMATGWYMRRILGRNIEHGTRRIAENMASGNVNLAPSLMGSPLLGAIITLGMGGSAGSEGPIAFASAAMGSNVARWMGLDRQQTTLLLAIGAGAGIAAIFKAPIGGVLFSIEVLAMPVTTLSMVALFVATLAAGLTAYAASGFTLDLPFPQMEDFSVEQLPMAVAMGVLCGLYSLYYNWQGRKAERFLGTIRRPWLRNLFSGLTIGVMLCLFPALFGEGYGIAGAILNGFSQDVCTGNIIPGIDGRWLLPIVCAGILAVKGGAVYVTNSGGGIAGEYAPTIFAGAVLGGLAVWVLELIPGLHLPTANLVYFAMAGAMAAIIRAPLMAIFIVVQISAGYSLLLPVTLCGVTAWAVARLLGKNDVA